MNLLKRGLLQRYFDEKMFIIPLKENTKVPKYRKWNEYSISYMEAERFLQRGRNIGAVMGKQSMKDGYELIAIDIDNRPAFNYDYYAKYGTWIQFTPNNGYHILLRVKPEENVTRIKWFLDFYKLNPHRNPFNPHHEENTFKDSNGKQISDEEHNKYFADTVRWSSMYIVVAPSQVNGKSYWWLDDCKGEIRKL